MTAHDVRLTSLSFALPYEGVDHAGGELLLQHHRVLVDHCAQVDVFAPEFEHNLPREGRVFTLGGNYHPSIVRYPWWRKTLVGKVLARLWIRAMPVSPDLGACVGFVTSGQLRDSVRSADIVELQWAEYMFFARFVRRLNPSAKIIGFVHDVPSQRIQRSVANWPAPLRRAYLGYVAMLERRLFRDVDAVVVLSRKDADLLAGQGDSLEICVLDPPLDVDLADTPKAAPTPANTAASFGFIAAFHRPENNDAALWLLEHIWPHVLKSVPEAHLYLIGSRPSDELRQASARVGTSVTVTGYVEDINSFNDRFSTAIIPLRYGAGVKFKTISAILAGKNIVATPTAVEGTLPDNYFYCVSDTSEVLAKAMVSIAENPSDGTSVATAAMAEVGSRYSLQRYADSVMRIYS